MLQAAKISKRSRREMLAGTCTFLTAVAVASGQSAAEAPPSDSELLALCAQYERTEAELDHFYENFIEPTPDSTAAYEFWKTEQTRLFQENIDAFDLVLARPAETIAGLAAKSNVLIIKFDRIEPNFGSEITVFDKRLEMALALAHNTMKIAKVRP